MYKFAFSSCQASPSLLKLNPFRTALCSSTLISSVFVSCWSKLDNNSGDIFFAVFLFHFFQIIILIKLLYEICYLLRPYCNYFFQNFQYAFFLILTRKTLKQFHNICSFFVIIIIVCIWCPHDQPLI